MLDDFRVGDVITVQGASVPRAYWERLFRVTAVDATTGLPTMRLLHEHHGATGAAYRHRCGSEQCEHLSGLMRARFPR